MRLKISSAKRGPFCLGLNVLTCSTAGAIMRHWYPDNFGSALVSVNSAYHTAPLCIESLQWVKLLGLYTNEWFLIPKNNPHFRCTNGNDVKMQYKNHIFLANVTLIKKFSIPSQLFFLGNHALFSLSFQRMCQLKKRKISWPPNRNKYFSYGYSQRLVKFLFWKILLLCCARFSGTDIIQGIITCSHPFSYPVRVFGWNVALCYSRPREQLEPFTLTDSVTTGFHDFSPWRERMSLFMKPYPARPLITRGPFQ